ncbi:hypothetical protein EV05_1397 [Prochlorococcus sp. MIT 0601]|nr:hypothetical protein EV05_1397 [Prochlorococcus sp. MIT 0601]
MSLAKNFKPNHCSARLYKAKSEPNSLCKGINHAVIMNSK